MFANYVAEIRTFSLSRFCCPNLQWLAATVWTASAFGMPCAFVQEMHALYISISSSAIRGYTSTKPAAIVADARWLVDVDVAKSG